MCKVNCPTAGDLLSPRPPSLNLKFNCKAKRPWTTAKVKNSCRQQERSILAFCLGRTNILTIITDGRAKRILHSLPPCTFRLSLQSQLGSPMAPAGCSSGKAHNSLRCHQQNCGQATDPRQWWLQRRKGRGGKRRWPPKDYFTWEDPEFETQIHSAVNLSKISFIIQPVPYSKAALPLSHFAAVTVMGLSDIFQWNNLPRETVVSSQWKLYINSNLLISLPHLLPQICEKKGKENMLIF